MSITTKPAKKEKRKASSQHSKGCVDTTQKERQKGAQTEPQEGKIKRKNGTTGRNRISY